MLDSLAFTLSVEHYHRGASNLRKNSNVYAYYSLVSQMEIHECIGTILNLCTPLLSNTVPKKV